jgi:hypothetical protein
MITTEVYYNVNDQLRREDGSTVECLNEYNLWCINGKELTEEELNLRLQK